MQEPMGSVAEATELAFGPTGRVLMRIAKALAIAGGLVFTALVVMSIISIVGRRLWSAPIPGDVEILQMCAAFASASFFAYCHLNRGDVKVDFFTHNFSPAVVGALDAFGSSLVGIFGALLTWRAGAGVLSSIQSGETSTVLGWPLWIPQMLMLPGLALLGLAGFYMASLYWRSRNVPRAVAA
jgi:TRAP-type C4-dicarboxylate transport system permease small subunit